MNIITVCLVHVTGQGSIGNLLRVRILTCIETEAVLRFSPFAVAITVKGFLYAQGRGTNCFPAPLYRDRINYEFVLPRSITDQKGELYEQGVGKDL